MVSLVSRLSAQFASASRKMIGGLATIATAFILMTGAGVAVNVALPTAASAQTVACPNITGTGTANNYTYYFSATGCAAAPGAGLTSSISFDDDNSSLVVSGVTYASQSVTGGCSTFLTANAGRVAFPYGTNRTCAYVFTFSDGSHFDVSMTSNGTGYTVLFSAAAYVIPGDTTPPVITVPGNITVTAASGQSSAVVTYAAPTANDAVDGARPVTQTAGLGSGASFPVGVTTNTFSSVDLSGNSASNSFTVTVNAAPVVLNINDATVTEGNSGFLNAVFTVSLDAAAGPGGVTFDIATADGTATAAGNDFTASSLTGQTIPQGGTSYTFNVAVLGDLGVEPNESFFVNVTNVTGATVGDAQGPGTITNDVFAAPAVPGQSPSRGARAGGTVVTITGTGFTGATAVSFGGAAAVFTVNSDTSITATTPAHATGPFDVTVTTAGGTSAATGTGNDYTYLGVTGITPTTLSNATVAASYSAALTATDCVGPCTFAVTGGALPAGLTLSSAGVLSGTPTLG